MKWNKLKGPETWPKLKQAVILIDMSLSKEFIPEIGWLDNEPNYIITLWAPTCATQSYTHWAYFSFPN